jgi:LCP family protein required for cell wall assembly
MNGIQQPPQKKRMRRLVLAPVFVLAALLMLISGCAARSTATPSSSPSPSATFSQTPPPTASATVQPSAIPRHLPRTVYPTPRIEPVSPIPSPLSGLSIPDEVRLIVLMGSDNPAPFTSRTDAMMLAFYNPRLAKVALLSLPPEMFAYIPGYTMQRVNVAYAVGGFEMLADTIQYNLGIRPDEFAVVHKDDFTWFVEELDGLNVNTLRNYYYDCGGIPAGSIHLRGGDVLCFVSFREDWDIRDQAWRQEQVVWQLFMRLAQGGKLVEIGEIYETYANTVQSNLTLPDLIANIGLALRLGQADRFGFFQLGIEDFEKWTLPNTVESTVLLPLSQNIAEVVQQAIDFTMVSVRSSDIVLTLEYQLTVSPTPTNTPTASPTHTATATFTATNTPLPPGTHTPTITPGGPTLTPSNTVEGYPGPGTATATQEGYP